MSAIVWDQVGEKTYETGVDHGVLYPYNSTKDESTNQPKGYDSGVAWNGLTGVTESPDGAEAEDLYADNIKYLSLISAEKLGLTVTAYTYPDEFMVCDGSAEIVTGVVIGQQKRQTFGLCYRTKYGNDTDGQDYAYKLHLIYGCLASPSDRDYSTVNDSPEAIEFSWEINTTPVPVTIGGVEYKPTASIIIDSSKFTSQAAKTKLTNLEKKLYGDENTDPYLPLPAEVYSTLSGT